MKEQGAADYFRERYKCEPNDIEHGYEMTGFAESYHRHRLESITEERIEEIVDSEAMSFRELQIRCRGAEALLNHLKNEKTRKPIP